MVLLRKRGWAWRLGLRNLKIVSIRNSWIFKRRRGATEQETAGGTRDCWFLWQSVSGDEDNSCPHAALYTTLYKYSKLTYLLTCLLWIQKDNISTQTGCDTSTWKTVLKLRVSINRRTTFHQLLVTVEQWVKWPSRGPHTSAVNGVHKSSSGNPMWCILAPGGDV